MTQYAACWRHVTPIDALPDLLANLNAGWVAIGKVTVYFRQNREDEKAADTSYRSWSYHFAGISERHSASSSPWSSHRLVASGESIHNLLGQSEADRSAIDNSLRTLKYPFDGIHGLAKLVSGNTDTLETGRSAFIEVVAPLCARLRTDKCVLENRMLRFQIESAAKSAVASCSLGLVSVPSRDHFISDSIHLAADKWTHDGVLYTYAGECEIPGVHQLTLILRLADWAVHRLQVLDYTALVANPRIAGYRVFDQDLDLFDQWLKQSGKANASQFESAVARLLIFPGFQVDRLGGSARLGDAVDILAYAPAIPVVLAVECASRNLGAAGKLGKLVVRAHGLRAALPDQDVIGLMVSALDRSEIPEAELSQAAEDEIAVLSQQDLNELQVATVIGWSVPDACIHPIASATARDTWAF